MQWWWPLRAHIGSAWPGNRRHIVPRPSRTGPVSFSYCSARPCRPFLTTVGRQIPMVRCRKNKNIQHAENPPWRHLHSVPQQCHCEPCWLGRQPGTGGERAKVLPTPGHLPKGGCGSWGPVSWSFLWAHRWPRVHQPSAQVLWADRWPNGAVLWRYSRGHVLAGTDGRGHHDDVRDSVLVSQSRK